MISRFALVMLCSMAAATLLGVTIAGDSGYVLFSYRNIRFESSLWAFIGLIVFCYAAYLGITYLIRVVLTSTGMVNPWSKKHRQRRVAAYAHQGLLALEQGQWAVAYKRLLKAAQRAPEPLTYYLGAARAAQALEQSETADAVLEEALRKEPAAELEIALLHAELQVLRKDPESALETLQLMRVHYPEHPALLKSLVGVYQQTQQYEALASLLPTVKKTKSLNALALQELEQQAFQGRLQKAAKESPQSIAALQKVWNTLETHQQQQPSLIVVYTNTLQKLGTDALAQETLYQALKKQLNPILIQAYGLLRGNNPLKSLERAERWLIQTPKDPDLLLCLGRLSLHAGLWAKARDYFEAGAQAQQGGYAHLELARLLGHLGHTEQSNKLYQKGLQLLDLALPQLPQPAHSASKTLSL